MPHPYDTEIQIPIPFDILVRAINQLSTEALSQLLYVTEAALAARSGGKSAGPVTEVEDERFWESELGRHIIMEADAGLSIEEVCKALSVIPGSFVAEISRERDER